MADQEQGNPPVADERRCLEIPTGRVKSIIKIDKDINRVNSEALYLIASSVEIFLQFLAEKSARVALEKKKRTVRVEHLRVAVKRHRPTSDFLLDSLPMPSRPPDRKPPRDEAISRAGKKASNRNLPFVTRSIDAFFQKST